MTKKDRQRLTAMVKAVRADRALLFEIPDAESSIDRLVIATDLLT